MFPVKNLYKLYSNYSDNNKSNLILILLLLVCIGLTEVIAVYSVMLIMAVLSGENVGKIGIIVNELTMYFGNGDSSELLLLVGVAVLSLLLSNIFNVFSIKKMMRVSYDIGGHISMAVYDAYLSMDYIEFINTPNSDKLKNIINSVDKIVDGIIIPLSQLIIKFISALFILMLLLYVDYTVALLVVIYLSLMIYLYHMITREIISRTGKGTNRISSLKIAHAVAGLNLKKELELYKLKDFFINIFKGVTVEYSSNESTRSIIAQIPKYAMESISIITLVLVSITMYNIGYSVNSIAPIIMMYLFAGYRIIPFVHNVFTTFSSVSYQMPLVEDVFLVVSNKHDNKILKKVELIERVEPNYNITDDVVLSLEKVSFSYNEIKILNNIYLTIRKGESIAIIGKSGEGKSTLINIMAGVLYLESGSRYIKKDVVMSYIPQKVKVINGSIKDNIIFGSDFCSDEFDSVIEQTVLGLVIKNLLYKEDSIIGEDGDLLSGGQLQRVGIARALYKKPDILIVDEGLNSLDSKTEDIILKNIFNSGITLIFITHNKRVLSLFNRIYELKDKSLSVCEGVMY